MDGGVATIPNAVSTTLFQGMVPPNGFMVRVFVNSTNTYGQSVFCFVNDHGPASLGGGFYMVTEGTFVSGTFISPPGYKPIGPVSIWCAVPGGTLYVAARGW